MSFSKQSEHPWTPENLDVAAAIAYILGKDQEFVLANHYLAHNGLPNMAKLRKDLDALEKSYAEGAVELQIDTALAKEQLEHLLESLLFGEGEEEEASDLVFEESDHLPPPVEELEQQDEVEAVSSESPEVNSLSDFLLAGLDTPEEVEVAPIEPSEDVPTESQTVNALSDFLLAGLDTPEEVEVAPIEQPEQSEHKRTQEELEVATAIAYIIAKDQEFVLKNDYLTHDGLPNIEKLNQYLDAAQQSQSEGNSELQIDTVLVKEQLQQLLEYLKSERNLGSTELAAIAEEVQAEKEKEEVDDLLFRNSLAGLIRQGGDEATKILQRLAERLSGTTKRIGKTLSTRIDVDSHPLAQATPELRDSIPEPVRKSYAVTSASLRDSLSAPVIGGGGKSTGTSVPG